MIVITQGDQIDLSLECESHDLTGATMTTIFRRQDGRDVSIANAQHTIAADQVANIGEFTLELLEADTKQFMAGENLEMITKVEQTGSIIHFHGENVLTVKKSTLRGNF